MTQREVRLKMNNNKHLLEFDSIEGGKTAEFPVILMLLCSETNDYGYYVSIKVKAHIDKMSCGVLIVIAALTVVGNCNKSQTHWE